MELNKINKYKKKYEKNKNGEINLIRKKNANLKSSYFQNENNKIINYIRKKITYQSFHSIFPKTNSINYIYNSNNSKTSIIRNYTNKNKINSTGNSLNKNKEIKKIGNDTDRIKIDIENKKSFVNKRKFFYSSKLSFSLDSILSKTLNKKQKKKKQKSFEKSKSKNLSQKKSIYKSNLKVNKTQKNILKTDTAQEKTKIIFNNKLQHSKINLEKNRKKYRHYIQKKGKVKSTNLTEIINHIKKTNILNNNTINEKSKNKDNSKKNKNINYFDLSKEKRDYLNNSKELSDILIDECCNAFNNQKFLGENNSTNDKSLNNRKEETNKKKIKTPNIIMNKYKTYGKSKVFNNIIKDNDSFSTNEFDLGNEQINKINGVRINDFSIKKPKEENLKFTFMKNEKESEVSFSHPSKIIIGNIDGYKDIIETDKKNEQKSKLTKCFNNLMIKKTNLFKGANKIGKEKDMVEFFMNGEKKKNSNLSTLLKKESEPIAFNEFNFWDSFNMTNNIDGISSTITNNMINERKEENMNRNINYNFNKASFINTEKSVEEFSKIVGYNFVNGNNFDILTNSNNNNKCSNKNILKESKYNKKENSDDANNNCKIF